MVLKSYAKINLTLSVNKKLKSGLHNIQSIYCLINLHDKIFLKKNKNLHFDQVSFTGPFSKDIHKSNNSVKKVLKVLRKNKIIHDYYSVKVNKKIPVFAGLGGGTSNAATLLKHLTKKNLNKKIFSKIIKEVGKYAIYNNHTKVSYYNNYNGYNDGVTDSGASYQGIEILPNGDLEYFYIKDSKRIVLHTETGIPGIRYRIWFGGHQTNSQPVYIWE